MTHITNKSDVSLLLAVWLATDEYNHSDDPKQISATSLLKPIKQIVLARQNMGNAKVLDVMDLVPSKMGTALHDSVEKAWGNLDSVKDVVQRMGVSKEIAESIIINPVGDIPDGMIPIYIEQRTNKKIVGWTISGAYDAVMDGQVFDIKSTSVWTHIFGSNDIKYAQQGSIYRWLNQDIIVHDILQIRHIFTDWSGVKARSDHKYPQSRILSKSIPLMDVPVTEKFITNILKQVDKLLPITDQSLMPACTDEELWREEDKYKFYKPNAKGLISYARATKVFNTWAEAQEYRDTLGKGGDIKEFKGGVKACKYCRVSQLCDQYKQLVVSGQIKD